VTKTQALIYLANCVEEAIVDAECDVSIFTGDEPNGAGGTRPDTIHAKTLRDALLAAGFTEAADKVAAVLRPVYTS
jgi:hypothetical protein